MKIGIIGAGNVGGSLGHGWAKCGHEVKYGVRDAASPKVAELLARTGANASAGTVVEAAQFGEVVVLATPWDAARDALTNAGNLNGKILLDCTNPFKQDFSGLEIGLTTSAGEQVASWAPEAQAVKIFNTAGANIMENPDFGGPQPSMFLCGDNADAKKTAAQLAADLGFDPVDAGPLEQARLLEPLAWLWVTMALKYGLGREIAFKLLRR